MAIGGNGLTVRMGQQPNHDGTQFTWFDVDSFPEELLISHSNVQDGHLAGVPKQPAEA